MKRLLKYTTIFYLIIAGFATFEFLRTLNDFNLDYNHIKGLVIGPVLLLLILTSREEKETA